MDPISFKHWSNKKYAVLNSLHKVIRIGTLSFAYGLLQLQPVLAQSDTTSPVLFYELEEVESVSEDELDIYAADLRTISLITRKEILASPAADLAQLIDLYPLTDIRTRGYHGVQSDLNIQGGSFDQSVVLLNGLNISDPQTGHFNLDLPLAHRQFEQVEILVGPATKTYGLNAYSGAVNLVTTPADSAGADAGLSIGQHGLHTANAAVHLPWGPVKTLFTVSSAASEGYRENTDFSSSGFYLHSNLQLKYLEADLMAGTNQKDFGANSFYTPRFPEQYEETAMQFAGLKITSLSVLPKIESNVYWRRHKDHFVLFRSDPSIYENHHSSDVFGGEITAQFSSILGVTRSGIKLRHERIVSSSLGLELPLPETDWQDDSISYNYGYQRFQPGLFVNHFLQYKGIKAFGGVLVHMLPGTGQLKFYPGIDLAFQLLPGLSMTTAMNRSMRLPSFTDLFYQGPQNVGNPELKPEEATTFESGLNYEKRGITGHASIFYRIGKETIDWVWEEDEKWHTQNITELNTFGGEISLSIDPGQWLNKPFFIDHIRTAYGYTEISRSAGDFISNYALDNLKHKWIFDVGFKLPYHFSISYNMRYYDRNGSYLSYDTQTASSIELPYENYLLNDVSLQFSKKRIAVYIELTNIFDVEYNNRGSVVQPGRWIIGGIRIYPSSAL